MRSLRVTDKLLLGILFLLPVFFSSPPRLLAVTIVEVYNDDAGEGFLDETALTDAEKNALAALGNDADTVGEARKNAFEHATSILENSLADTSTIRISAGFLIFDGQEDPEDPDKCAPPGQGLFVIAAAGLGGFSYFGDRFMEGDADNPGLGTAYPIALFEALAGRNLNGDNADIFIGFSKCIEIYYGITQRAPQTQIDFILVALHEIIHGLGFYHQINEDGSFELTTVRITEGNPPVQRLVVIRSRTIYDEQTYSETDDDLLINLTNGERAAAITSDTGLLWEGTDSGRNSCSYGQLIAEGKPDSAKSLDGKPRLHAPSIYRGGSSVAHTHANTEDIMEAIVPIPENMDLALGMLKDVGWSVSADGFPTVCGPDVTVSFGQASYSVAEGGEVTVTVTLSADPERTVDIPFMVDSSSTAGTGDYSPLPASVTFTSGQTSQDITLTVTDDAVNEGSEQLILGFGTLPERVSAGTTSSTTVTIADNDEPPAQTPDVTVSFGAAQNVTEGASATVTVTLSSDPLRDILIPITVGGTAQAGDYSGVPASVMFAGGDTGTSLTKSITLVATDDSAYEPTAETVILGFGTSLPTGVTAGTTNSTTVTIADNDPPPAVTVSFGGASYRVTEGGSVTVAVTLNADPERDVTIPVTVNTSSTAQDADYSGVPASVTFASGETSKNITLSATDDTADEDESETVILDFGTLPERVSAGTTSSTTVTIVDNDDPEVTVSFGAASYRVTEGASVAVTVTLSADPERDVTIPFTVNATSTALPADYSLPASLTFGSVTIASGEISKDITLAAVDDTADEDENETVVLDFGTLPERVSAGTTSSTTVTITDNDDPAVTVSFGAASYRVTEGGSVAVTVTLNADPERTVEIPFTVSGTAEDTDYSLEPATSVTFASGDTGDALTKSITLTSTDDSNYEGNETVIINFGMLPAGVTTGTHSMTTVTIADNDPPPAVTVSFGSASYRVTEGGSVDVAVKLSEAPGRSVTIPITASGTAADTDYSGVPASLTFTAGQTSKNFTVAATDDTADEQGETVILNFGTLPEGVSAGTTASTTVTIANNDDPPEVTVSFGSASYSVAEGTAVTVAVTLSADPGRSIAIPFMVDSSSTATTADYSLPASVTFASGETSKNITLTATDDTADETNETVIINFGTSLPQGVTAATPSSATVTITDNDDPQPQPPSPSTESGGGCSVGADRGTASAAAHLLAAIALVLPAFFRKNRPAD